MATEYSNQYDVQQILAEEALAKEQSYLTNAVNLANTPGAGMMMRAQGVGRREGEAYAGLGRMLTGEETPVDPRVAKQDALMKIFEEYGEPENYEDMVKIANVLRVNGFPGEANLAMKEASQFKIDQTNRINATASADSINKGVEASLALFRTTKEYLAANTPTKQLALESAHIKKFNKLNDQAIQDYAAEIAGYMAMTNPDTGNLYTNPEATKLAAERQRETTEQVLAQESGKINLAYMAKFQQDTDDDAYTASTEIQGLENIIEAYKNGGQTGQLQSTMIALQGYLKDFGFEMDEDRLANSEVLVKEFASIALGRMGQLSGSASDNDILFVKQGAASLDKTKGANMLLVDMALFYAKEKQQQALFLNDFISTFDGVPTQNQISKAMRAFKNRGDTSEKAMNKYGKTWGSEEERLALVEVYGTNQYDRKGQLEKLSNIEVDADAIEIEADALATLDAFLESLD